MVQQGRLEYIRMLSYVEYYTNLWVSSWLQAAVSHLLLTLMYSWQSFVVTNGEDTQQGKAMNPKSCQFLSYLSVTGPAQLA